MNSLGVTVIGSGVSGLTTAVLLQEQGYTVRIITRDPFQETVSAVAAAIWFPYEARPVDKVNAWSLSSFNHFGKLADDPDSGVSLIPFSIVEKDEAPPYWLTALPDGLPIIKESRSILNQSVHSYRTVLPLIESPVYLPWLMQRFLDKGGMIEERTLQSLDELGADHMIINCTGLGAKELADDPELYPIRGQILKAEASDSIEGFSIEYPLDSYEEEIMYVIPRRDALIIGGSAMKGSDSTEVDSEQAERIWNRALQMNPQIKDLQIRETKVGLRPGRSSIRLERDANRPHIIHNYGHGGAGYTVSRGCAEEVLKLIQQTQC